jgi:polysaccharide export outer membrane protein
MVNRPQGTFSQQIRIVGATARPAAIPYRANMTLLDGMIAVGGLAEYAAGNRARLIRVDRQTGQQREYDLRITDLLRRGDVRANVRLEPGDVIIIPESMF